MAVGPGAVNEVEEVPGAGVVPGVEEAPGAGVVQGVVPVALSGPGVGVASAGAPGLSQMGVRTETGSSMSAASWRRWGRRRRCR